ncbi:MAG TPA: helix-turn-helix domain-containing protein [Capsulimonadaceae bacterium]|jgi:AraC family transcriptional regulator of arabinose operon
MSNPTRETQHSLILELSAGRFHEDATYATWRTNGTPDWLLVYSLAGHGRFGFEGGEIVTDEHDVVLIRPRVPHDYGTAHGAERWDLLWTHFHPPAEWRDLLDWPEVAPGIMRLQVESVTVQSNVIGALDKMHRHSHGPLRRRLRFAVNSLEQALLWLDTVNPRAASAKMDPRIHSAIDYMLRNIGRKVTVTEVAESCDLSVSRLAHLFQEQVGQSPQQFLETERLDRARQLLRVSDQAIQIISAGLGFDNAFYFSRRFKHRFSMSPREYRQKQG